MLESIEQLVSLTWNRLVSKRAAIGKSDLVLGQTLRDGEVGAVSVIPQARRTEHIAVLGKTGTGKSSLLKSFVLQDIEQDRGFVFFDLHGDAKEFLLSSLAAQEAVRRQDLSERLIVIEPSDEEYSVGLNVLERQGRGQNFVHIAEVAQILKARWHLDALGARTEELLRNALFVLSENHLTLVELAPLLTNLGFRRQCLEHVVNAEVRHYFEIRYDPLSATMQQTFREAVLNKTTAFTADPHFRHILGQQRSSFDLVEAMDKGYWILLSLPKGRLGEQATTLGSLFLSKLKNAVFARKSRKLFTLYCDEIQNLVSFDSSIDSLFAESRKFGISVVSANQFLEQYPTQMKAAILAVGTHILFQLATDDAHKMASALGGGKQLSELLRHLPHRQVVVKTGSHRWQHVSIPDVPLPKAEFQDLLNRSRKRWATPIAEVERQINIRVALADSTEEALDDWD